MKDLDAKDLVLAKAVLDIHRKRTHSDFVKIHALDRGNSLAATEKRAGALRQNREELLQRKEWAREILAEYLPSVSGLKVVKERDGLAAMQQVFTPDDDLLVEVELSAHEPGPQDERVTLNRQ